MLSEKLPLGIDVLKIDIPDNATPKTPWHLTRLARHPYYSVKLPKPTMESKVKDAVVLVDPSQAPLEPGTDVHVMTVEQEVSVTPLTLDATAETDFSRLKQRIERT